MLCIIVWVLSLLVLWLRLGAMNIGPLHVLPVSTTGCVLET